MQTILTVIFGVTSVALAIYTILRAKQKRPVWAYETTRMIGLGNGVPPELELTFNGQPIRDACQTILIFFNKGNKTIRKDDVAKKVVVNFEGAEILRKPIVRVRSKESIRFSAESSGNSVILSFLYLDHNDGAVIDVLHTKTENITCSGDIMGAKNIEYIGEFVLFRNRHTHGWWAKFVAILLVPFLGFLIAFIMGKFEFTTIKDILPDVLALISFYLGFFAARPRNAYILKKFPDWSFY